MVIRSIARLLHAGTAPLRRLQLGVVVAGLVVAGCLWAFAAIAWENSERGGGASGFDQRILDAFRDPSDRTRSIGPTWVAGAARDITALGSGTVIAILVGVVSLGFVATGRGARALLVLGACLSGFGVSVLLKALFGRERPDPDLHGVAVWSSSFPSGHSMNSAVVYLTLAVLVAESLRKRRAVVFALATGIGLAAIVGVSRVYLGVHWPTDVLAGWAAGFAWATLWWLVAIRVRDRGGPASERAS